jgi:hypothetical protein
VRKFNRQSRAVRRLLTGPEDFSVSFIALIPAYTDFIISLIEVIKIANADWNFKRINSLFDPSSWPTTESEPDQDPQFPFIFPEPTQLAITAFRDNESKSFKGFSHKSNIFNNNQFHVLSDNLIKDDSEVRESDKTKTNSYPENLLSLHTKTKNSNQVTLECALGISRPLQINSTLSSLSLMTIAST